MCTKCNLQSSMPYEETYLLGSSSYLPHAGFLFDLFFDPEDGRDMFLRNVIWLSTDYTATYPIT
jgi:hypothetical protein